MTMFEISETRLPIPKGRAGRPSIYPHSTMVVGAHFDTPDNLGENSVGGSMRLATVAAAGRSRKLKLAGKKFITRKEAGGIIRCWRLA